MNGFIRVFDPTASDIMDVIIFLGLEYCDDEIPEILNVMKYVEDGRVHAFKLYSDPDSDEEPVLYIMAHEPNHTVKSAFDFANDKQWF